jgi:hypothetical protein
MVPICKPARRHRLRKSAASMWSCRSGLINGKAANRSIRSLRARGPVNPCRSSLQNESSGHHDRTAVQGVPQGRDFRGRRNRVAAKRQGPHTRVDKENHKRVRARL